MALEFIKCPVCKQKLGLYDYLMIGTDVVCANCETNLRVVQQKPLKLEHIPITDTFNINDRPESYG